MCVCTIRWLFHYIFISHFHMHHQFNSTARWLWMCNISPFTFFFFFHFAFSLSRMNEWMSSASYECFTCLNIYSSQAAFVTELIFAFSPQRIQLLWTHCGPVIAPVPFHLCNHHPHLLSSSVDSSTLSSIDSLYAVSTDEDDDDTEAEQPVMQSQPNMPDSSVQRSKKVTKCKKPNSPECTKACACSRLPVVSGVKSVKCIREEAAKCRWKDDSFISEAPISHDINLSLSNVTYSSFNSLAPITQDVTASTVANVNAFIIDVASVNDCNENIVYLQQSDGNSPSIITNHTHTRDDFQVKLETVTSHQQITRSALKSRNEHHNECRETAVNNVDACSSRQSVCTDCSSESSESVASSFTSLIDGRELRHSNASECKSNVNSSCKGCRLCFAESPLVSKKVSPSGACLNKVRRVKKPHESIHHSVKCNCVQKRPRRRKRSKRVKTNTFIRVNLSNRVWEARPSEKREARVPLHEMRWEWEMHFNVNCFAVERQKLDKCQWCRINASVIFCLRPLSSWYVMRGEETLICFPWNNGSLWWVR